MSNTHKHTQTHPNSSIVAPRFRRGNGSDGGCKFAGALLRRHRERKPAALHLDRRDTRRKCWVKSRNVHLGGGSGRVFVERGPSQKDGDSPHCVCWSKTGLQLATAGPATNDWASSGHASPKLERPGAEAIEKHGRRLTAPCGITIHDPSKKMGDGLCAVWGSVWNDPFSGLNWRSAASGRSCVVLRGKAQPRPWRQQKGQSVVSGVLSTAVWG